MTSPARASLGDDRRLPVRRSDGEIYEYVCHEANYGLDQPD